MKTYIVWLGLLLEEAEREEACKFIQEETGCGKVEYVCEYDTLPNIEDIENTGGRHDALFSIEGELGNLPIWRIRRGGDIKWYSDCVNNFGEIIPQDIKDKMEKLVD